MLERSDEGIARTAGFYGVLAAIVIVAAGLTTHHLLLSSQPDARLAGMPIPVQTVAAKVQSVDEVIGASGAIEPSMLVNITNKVVSNVLRVPVDEGSEVRPGDLLVEFDPALYSANLESATTSYDHWHRQLERMKSLEAQDYAAAIDVENTRAAEARSWQAVVSARFDLANTRIYSPVAGVVLSRSVNPGEVGRIDDNLIELGVLDPIFMNAAVPEDELGYVYAGMEAQVGTDAFPGEVFRGTVSKIDSTVDPATRTFAVYVRLQNSDLRLKKGVTGYARLVGRRTALVVPGSAIMNPVGDKPTVFVIDTDNHAHVREVRIGLSSGGLTEIVSGLQEGEQVVVAGQLGLRDSDIVRVNQNAPWNNS
jgi:membrane fusion protein, multidrug efflux system